VTGRQGQAQRGKNGAGTGKTTTWRGRRRGPAANELLWLSGVGGCGPFVTQWVFDAGVDASICDSSRPFASALHNVTRPDVARQLIASGARVHARDDYSRT